jgi:hypothetical protein
MSQKKSCTSVPARVRRRGLPRTRHHKPIVLTEEARRTLEQWVRRPTTAQRLASRSQIVTCVTLRSVVRSGHCSIDASSIWIEMALQQAANHARQRLLGIDHRPRAIATLID